MSLYTLWILLSGWLVFTGWVLSFFKQLNAVGYLVSLLIFCLLVANLFQRGVLVESWKSRGVFFKTARRFTRPMPCIYLVYLVLAIVGGAIYEPTNYDAICYRIPRVLHWWNDGGWHWINDWNARMDYSATCFEWLMAPLLIVFKSDRLVFLINIISYALLPGLIYSAFTELGISRRVSWCWMWILPSGYCFVLQAGSIANDMFACVFFLSAVCYGLRSLRCQNWGDGAIALLAGGLLTGAKASNLPLLLPLAVILFPMLKILFKKPILTSVLLVFSIVISFVPIAVSNLLHSGDWSGDPHNKERMKLVDPSAAIEGNAIQIVIGMLAPPVLPMAASINSAIGNVGFRENREKLKKNFPRVNPRFGEIPTEEGAGLGLGICILVIATVFLGLLRANQGIQSRKAILFGILCWISVLVYSAKMGSESSARLIAAYYPGLLLPVLGWRFQRDLTGKKWWRYMACAAQLMVLPSIIINPARPLLPVQEMTDFLDHSRSWQSLASRACAVYSVYGRRNDGLAIVRDNLPISTRNIFFAGTSDESEYSFWKPFGARKVSDMQAQGKNNLPFTGSNIIVGSQNGIHDRFGLTPEQFVQKMEGTIIWSGLVSTRAGGPPSQWFIISALKPNSE